MVLSGRLDVETGNEKFKMAAAKPEVHVSWLLYKIAKKFQRATRMFSGSGISGRFDVETRSQKFKMAVAKPDVPMYLSL